jgi:hypothetical protein
MVKFEAPGPSGVIWLTRNFSIADHTTVYSDHTCRPPGSVILTSAARKDLRLLLE